MAKNKYKPNCKICMSSKSDPKLRARIYDATFRREDGDETLANIAEEFGLTQASMYNHSRKHIKERKSVNPLKVEKQIARVKGKIAKELELSFEHDNVIPKEDFETGMDEVIAKGLADLRNAGSKVTINQLLAAIKIKTDYRSKRRGQDVEIVKTMYRSMNGITEEPGRLAPGRTV